MSGKGNKVEMPSVNTMRAFIVLGTFVASFFRGFTTNYALLFAPIFAPIAQALINIGILGSFGILLGIETDPMFIPVGFFANIVRREISFETNPGTIVMTVANLVVSFIGHILGGLTVLAISGPLPVAQIAQNYTGGTYWAFFFAQMLFVLLRQLMFLLIGVWSFDGYGAVLNRIIADAGIAFLLKRLTGDFGDYGLTIAAYVHAGTAGIFEDWFILLMADLAAALVGFLMFWGLWSWFLPAYVAKSNEQQKCCVKKDMIFGYTDEVGCAYPPKTPSSSRHTGMTALY